MAELLLELFSEEIPARMQAQAARDLQDLVARDLKEARLNFESVETHVTVRRLVLMVDGLDLMQPDLKEERRGPRVDAPEKAIEGFLKSTGLKREDLEEREEKKGTFLYAVIEKSGKAAADVLAELLPQVIYNFPWPKSQRWGAKSLRWVRPLHSVLCLLDGEVVPFEVADGLTSSRTTRGHRFLAPDVLEIANYADYKEKLSNAYVLLDADARKALIDEQARALATAQGLALVDDEGLLNEVVGLAEWPVPLLGRFDDDFLAVPQEALTSAMRSHQKYFSLKDPKTGNLAPYFITVSNMKTGDDGRKIVAGNERVLRARLSDTKFFWDQDQKQLLEDRVAQLDDIVFHAELGNMGERVQRIRALAAVIAKKIGADEAAAVRAAQLCKADLVTGMVGEFPDLQGLMGKYYADAQNEDASVSQAIADHYSPKGPMDTCPSAPVSIAVAMAEKLDTLVGFFAIDEKPTGSKDPFALRRAALGVIRLIIENKLRLSLRALFLEAFQQYKDQRAESMAARVEMEMGQTLPASEKEKLREANAEGADKVVAELLAFFADRLKVHLKGEGVRHDLVAAVFALGDEDDLVRLLARVDALNSFIVSDDGVNLLAGYKRASNIVRIEEKKDNTSYIGQADAGLLAQDEEKELFKRLLTGVEEAKDAIGREAFGEAMISIATLRAPIDTFFEQVTVNSDDRELRKNRLLLLSQIRSALNEVADFSIIEG
ncbi:MAG: glycine--tRNA ligase subunit beta [Kordiimonas sp.]|nr:glycine--tRNA ligase subunit beta [Kordiimonas sp.]